MPALGLGLCLKLLTGSAHRHAATLTLAGAPHSHHQHASPCIRSERCRRPMHDARPSRGQLLSSYSPPRVIHCAGDPCMTPAPHASVPDTVCRCIPCVYSTLTREGRADACVHRCSVSVLNIQLSHSLSLERALSLPLAPSHIDALGQRQDERHGQCGRELASDSCLPRGIRASGHRPRAPNVGLTQVPGARTHLDPRSQLHPPNARRDM